MKHLTILKYFLLTFFYKLKYSNLNNDNNAYYISRKIFEHGNIEYIKLLLSEQKFNPSFGNNFAIRFSSEKGNIEAVNLLISDPRVDPSVDSNFPICIASYNGHIEIIKLLLTEPRVTPAERNNYAITIANEKGHVNIVKLLWQIQSVKKSLKKDNISLYNLLTEKELIKKINNFN